VCSKKGSFKVASEQPESGHLMHSTKDDQPKDTASTDGENP